MVSYFPISCFAGTFDQVIPSSILWWINKIPYWRVFHSQPIRISHPLVDGQTKKPKNLCRRFLPLSHHHSLCGFIARFHRLAARSATKTHQNRRLCRLLCVQKARELHVVSLLNFCLECFLCYNQSQVGLGARTRINIKLNPRMTPGPGFKLGLH